MFKGRQDWTILSRNKWGVKRTTNFGTPCIYSGLGVPLLTSLGLSEWTALSCAFSLAFWGNPIPQVAQMNGVSPAWILDQTNDNVIAFKWANLLSAGKCYVVCC